MGDREMIDIKLYDTGKLEVVPAPDRNCATQLFSFGGRDGSGLTYRCPKAKKRQYLRKILEIRQEALAKEIEKLRSDYDKAAHLYMEVLSGKY